MTLIVKVLDIKEGYNAHAVFENGDGTCYSMIVTPDPYGGYIFVVNNDSVYRYYEDNFETKHLCGTANIYTEYAVKQIARQLI